MNRFLAVLIAALLVVSMAGCASKETSESVGDASVDVENVVDPAEPVADVNLTPDGPDATPVETAESDLPESVSAQNADFMGVIPREIDENISSFRVYCNDPDIAVEKAELVDERDYAESTKWHIETLIKNTAAEPVYYYWYYGEESADLDERSLEFDTLYAGESVRLSPFLDKKEYSLEQLPDLYIIAHTTTMPLTSSEFTKFKTLGMKSSAAEGQYAFVDVLSLDLVTDESKGWRTAVATVSAARNVEAKVDFKGLGSETTIIPAGQAVQVERPLKETDEPDDLTGIYVTVTLVG